MNPHPEFSLDSKTDDVAHTSPRGCEAFIIQMLLDLEWNYFLINPL
jgi:hypothetical protein